jgi:hypothetical protein
MASSPGPSLNLTHGQILWTLSRGTSPERRLVDHLRYLRLLGVPFRKSELGAGRGNRVRYRYDHLIELGVAVWALERGMRPREVAKFLVEQRKYLRPLYAKAFADQPDRGIEAEWVKSRGRIVPLLGKEIFLRLHDRYSEAPGKIEMLDQPEIKSLSDFFMLAEKYPGEKTRTLLPLTRLALELVAWAREAPEVKPGP